MLHFYSKSLSPATSTTIAALESTMKEVKDVAVTINADLNKTVHLADSYGNFKFIVLFIFAFNFLFLLTRF